MQALAPEERIDLAIGGMTCAACARRVERALQRAPGVHDAVVNLATHRATVVYEPGATAPAQLAAAVADAGYRASPAGRADERDAEARVLGIRALVALVLAVPVVALGMAGLMLPWWIGYALAAGVLVAGAPIGRAAFGALRHASTDMNVLVSLGALASFGYGYLEASVSIVGFVLLGRWLEARARRRAGEALGRLRRLVPPSASVLVDGVEKKELVERLKDGDLVVVRPGQTLPVDGDITDGATSVAEAVLTGEAMPIEKRVGDLVFAGTTNGWGRIVVRAKGDASATALAKIVAAVESAMGSRAPIARLADRVAAIFTPVVLGVALVTFAAWLALGRGTADAVNAAVAVLVVACPCALGLATPTALVVGLGRAADAGVLFTSAAALEHLGAIDTIVVDKTGTLTEGQPILVRGPEDDKLLARVAGAEEGSEHPLAGAFLRAAGARKVVVPPASDFTSTPGRGVTATVDGHRMIVGSPGFARAHQIEADIAGVLADGLTPVVAIDDGALAGVYGIGDAPRAGAKEAIAALAAAKVRVVMLTGDAQEVADRVAAELGIKKVIARVLPADKAREVKKLRRKGRHVAMVGDGVNDAPALAAAHVGIAMGSATDVAAASAAVILLSDDLAGLPRAVALARRTLAVIRQNLVWAFGYNVLALPAAASGFLSPMLAAGLMAFSSVSVVLNSLKLRAAHETVARPLRKG